LRGFWGRFRGLGRQSWGEGERIEGGCGGRKGGRESEKKEKREVASDLNLTRALLEVRRDIFNGFAQNV